ncbi:MAG TPA: hypothetical protein VF581_07170 [Flavobacterium sp.]|jgi:hypothetical protein
MKKILFSAVFAALFVSCSTEDDSPPDTNPALSEYLPLADENYWTYDVEGATVSGRDSLYVANDTVINGTPHKRMETGDVPFGFYSGALKNNGIRNANGSLMVSGAFGLDLGETFPVDIALNNFVILSDDASANQELSSVSGEIEQTFEGYPLILDYTLSSTATQTLPSFTSPNGDVYTDVKVVRQTLNMKISYTTDDFGFPITIPILQSQDVLVSNTYFAKNIGMVYAQTTYSYDLEDLSQAGIELPIPSSGMEVQEEFLDTSVTASANAN